MTDTGGKPEWNQVKSLFSEVLGQPEGEREAFLEAACAGDEALRSAVVALLVASEQTGGKVEDAIRIAASTLQDETPGETIDHYRIEHLIGEGGMGDVYLASRADGAFRQNVAIKLLGHRRPGQELLRRFRVERQILATLEHPNIARLIDGGETARGVPYLVMEYVDGQSVTHYSDTKRLNIQQRLQLFLKICAAVQHAHRNLVIHRDIKPGNILVRDDGEPKLLDFGIAKLLSNELTGQTLVETMDSARLMTPWHASPEQIRGEKITVATDVYSLGVLLYELLSGIFPYDITSTRAAEIEKAICDTDPARPSARLTQSGASDTAVQIADARRLRVTELARQLGGDLDTIILKAMHKAPDRRYETVREFALDIERYLERRPVLARPDSVVYRVSRFLSRNRLPASIATSAVLLVVTATSFAFARVAAERDTAQAERHKAEAINAFMQQIFEEADPEVARGDDVSARDLLAAGAAKIESELAEQPDTQATMMRVLGDIYYNMGDHDNARLFMTRALDSFRSRYGDQHPDVATALLVLGFVAQDLGDLETAAVHIEKALRIRESLYGQFHPDTIEAISARAFLNESEGDYVGAETLHLKALDTARRTLDGDHEFTAELMTKLAGIYRIQARNDEAEPLLIDALAMQDRLYGGPHPTSSDTKRQLAGLYRETRRFEKSEALYQQVIAEREQMLGPDHPELANTWNSYSQLLSSMNEIDRAVEAHGKFLAILERRTNGPHPSFGAGYNNYAFLLRQKGDLEAAEKYFRLSIEMQDAVDLPPRHPNRSFPLGGLSLVYLDQKRYAEASDAARQVIDMRREHFAETHRLVQEPKNTLGAALTGLGQFEEAEQWLMDAYSTFLAEYGQAHPGVSLAAHNLAELFRARGNATMEQHWREIEAQAQATEKQSLNDN